MLQIALMTDKTAMMRVRMSADDLEGFKLIAKQQGLSLSAWVLATLQRAAESGDDQGRLARLEARVALIEQQLRKG
jgi:hypothetical protein